MKRMSILGGVFLGAFSFFNILHLNAENDCKIEKKHVVSPSEKGVVLIELIKSEDTQKAKDLFAETEFTQNDLNLALGWAANNGDFSLVKFLVVKGANINERNINKLHFAPIRIATTREKVLVEKLGQETYLKFLELLLTNGADPNTRSRCRSTPIVDLVLRGNFKACALLLKYGARCDVPDYQQQYPSNAHIHEHYEGEKELISAIAAISWLEWSRILAKFKGLYIKKIENMSAN